MFKARLKFEKMLAARYISHLDLMNLIQRSIARAGLPVWYTEGFNPHAYISILLPLPTGVSGEYELMDFQFTTDEIPPDAVQRLNAAFPAGIRALEIYQPEMPVRDIAYAEYEICIEAYGLDAGSTAGLFLNGPQMIVKRSKRGEKEVDINEFIKSLSAVQEGDTTRIRALVAAGNVNLNPEYITGVIREKLPDASILYTNYHRTAVFNEKMEKFR